ncbi:response regulator transcription factor [Campylobacterota bacterium]
MFSTLLIQSSFDEINFDSSDPIKKVIFDYDNSSSNIDIYITNEIIPQLIENNFSLLIIEAGLSETYTNFYGLDLAHHIRLDINLSLKRYVPIIIIYDDDPFALNKLTTRARILFTKSIAVSKNSQIEIENLKAKISSKSLTESLTEKNFQVEFLDKLIIKPPNEFHHRLSNEWSVYRWSQYLKLFDSTYVNNTKEKVSSLLYFKYLITKFPITAIEDYVENQKKIIETKQVKESGRVLYIDDEWDIGWKDIFEKFFRVYFSTSTHVIDLKTVCKTFNSFDKEQLILDLESEVKSYDPDIVILDMRLHNDDHKIKSTNDYSLISGVQLLDKIRKFNPGIQCIILTASNKSKLLEVLHERNILSYIKKEDPEFYADDTANNIAKLCDDINIGLKNKYLKEIWRTAKSIETKLKLDLFNQYGLNLSDYEDNLNTLKKETEYVFDVLNSNMNNKLNYAMLSMARSIEALQKIFIYEKSYDNPCFWDGDVVKNRTTLKDKVLSIIKQKMHYIDVSDIETELEALLLNRNYYLHSNPKYKQIDPVQLITWFNLLDQILEKVLNPLPRPEPKSSKPRNPNSKLKIKSKKNENVNNDQ